MAQHGTIHISLNAVICIFEKEVSKTNKSNNQQINLSVKLEGDNHGL